MKGQTAVYFVRIFDWYLTSYCRTYLNDISCEQKHDVDVHFMGECENLESIISWWFWSTYW